MITSKTLKALVASAGAAAALALAVPAAHADGSLSGVENSRAKERAGGYLTRQDRDSLRRYGSNDDGYWSGYRSYGYGYGGPGISVYVGPGPGYGYGPYGY